MNGATWVDLAGALALAFWPVWVCLAVLAVLAWAETRGER